MFVIISCQTEILRAFVNFIPRYLSQNKIRRQSGCQYDSFRIYYFALSFVFGQMPELHIFLRHIRQRTADNVRMFIARAGLGEKVQSRQSRHEIRGIEWIFLRFSAVAPGF
jgi:hypothetical protein